MNTSNLRILESARIMPVVDLQPLYLFDGVDKWPPTREGVQKLFREVVQPKRIASVNFLRGTDLLASLSSLMAYLEDMAEIFSYDIQIPADTELNGGYAFVESGEYVFGVEDGATILDMIEWESSIEQLIKNRQTEIRHSCNYPFEARLEKERVILRNKRKDLQYSMPFKNYQSEIWKATEALRKFAMNFVPIYASKLNVPDPYKAAIWNFENHPQWFENQKIAV